MLISFDDLKFTLLYIILLIQVESWAQNLGHGYEFQNNGKSSDKTVFDQTYKVDSHIVDSLPILSAAIEALNIQLKYLSKIDKVYSIDGLKFSSADLIKVANLLKVNSSLDQFNCHKIQGEDQKGNVHFTGYYVPIIHARRKPDAVFRYPLYRKPNIPKSQIPSRQAIDFKGSLKGKNLEIAYTASLLDNYVMQVQGSGVLQYEDGSTDLLSYGGTNGRAYASIGRYLVDTGQISSKGISKDAISKYFESNPDSLEGVLSRNASYTFFVKNGSKPVGAANVPLTGLHSIAVDPSYIPLGSILLAKVPTLDAKGSLLGHEFRLVVAQDKGGAIKGPGHVDLYFGVGDRAVQSAGNLHHYGSLWLLLPKE